jgi:hypothetical protein
VAEIDVFDSNWRKLPGALALIGSRAAALEELADSCQRFLAPPP